MMRIAAANMATTMSDGDANAALADLLSKKSSVLKDNMDELRNLPMQIQTVLDKIDAVNAKLTSDIKSVVAKVDALVDKTEAMSARLDSFHQRITHMEEKIK